MSTTMMSGSIIDFGSKSGVDRYSQVGIPKTIMTSSTTWTCVVQVWKTRCVNTGDSEMTRRLVQEDQDWSSSSQKVCIDSLIVVQVCFKNMNIYRDSVEDL